MSDASFGPSKFRDIIQTVDIRSSIKVFFIIFILAIIFFIVYILIKPDQSRKIGVLAFPNSGPFVPFDSSSCGRNIINCTNGGQTLCNSECQSQNYSCTHIPSDKEVWYLGTKLSSPDGSQSYCLPSQDIDIMAQCGTYTGKALWNQTTWACQCKYPSLFSGDDCQEQIACNPGNGSKGKLKRADGKIWDPINPGGIDSSDNPLDWDTNGKPLYSCDCSNINGAYTKSDDPYRCHFDLCYGGSTTPQPSANFNTETNQCECDNITTVKSNVSGFCYPVESPKAETGCFPDILTGNCTCGNKFINTTTSWGPMGYFFRNGSDYFITWQDPADQIEGGKCQRDAGGLIQPLNCPIYKVRINSSTATDSSGRNISQYIQSLLADNWISTTLPSGEWMRNVGFDTKGTMIEFQLMQYPTRNDVNIESDIFKSYIRTSFEHNGFNGDSSTMVASMLQAVSNNSFVIPCDSFFYNRTNDVGCGPNGCVKCNDPYFSASDLDNKNGTFCFSPTDNQLCGGHGTAHINLFDPVGYSCDCANDNRSYNADTIQSTPTGKWLQHTCLQSQRGNGDACSHDDECLPFSHCNCDCMTAPGLCGTKHCGAGC